MCCYSYRDSVAISSVCASFCVFWLQAASYGFGVMAQKCSKDFSQACLG